MLTAELGIANRGKVTSGECNNKEELKAQDNYRIKQKRGKKLLPKRKMKTKGKCRCSQMNLYGLGEVKDQICLQLNIIFL